MKKIRLDTIGEQIRRNAVALISLTVAISSLGYNTWRNETTEAQRNDRYAGFELVEQLSELQSVVNNAAYNHRAACTDDGVLIEGWGKVLAIDSLGALLTDAVAENSVALHTVWQNRFNSLCSEERSEREDADQAITSQISATKKSVMDVLISLD